MKRLLSYFFFISVQFFFGQIPTSGLIGGWTFSGNASDISGSGNHGTVNGATLVADRFNTPNAAYEFDGINDYIVMFNAGPTGSVSRSVSFWAKTTKTTIEVPFNYGEAASPGGIFQVVFNYNCQGVGIDNSQDAYIRPSSGLNNNSWHHVVAIYNSSVSTNIGDVEIYVDGSLIQGLNCLVGSTTSAVQSNATHPITIGRSSNGMIRLFKGTLDDFYFYDRALTEDEVYQLYSYSPCTSPPESIGNVVGMTQACFGLAQTYSVPPVANATSYIWYLPGGWIGSSNTNTILVTPNISGGFISVAATNGCGTTSVSSLYIAASVCTDMRENSQDQIVLFPNPVVDYLTAIGPAVPIEIRIYSLDGQVLLRKTSDCDRIWVDTRSLSAGVYLVQMRSQNKNFVRRIIKE